VAGAIICCVDGSAESFDAVRVAQGLAERLRLELVLLFVAAMPMRPGVSAAPLGQERLVEAERIEGEQLLLRAASDAGVSDTVSRRVEVGDAVERVLAVCEEERAEMVVLGSRGGGGVRAALLGSVSRDVAAKARCLVLVVPPGAAERSALA
jgi:nucleotide-binding universal stress UspA family protein